MQKSAKKIINGFILITFVAAIFCSLGICSGMMKMANADEPNSMMQQNSGFNGQENPCSPLTQSNKANNCNCCKCLDTAALLQSDHKSQVLASTFDFSKAFLYLATLVTQVSRASHLRIFDNSPPQIALNSTPIYILNRVLRL